MKILLLNPSSKYGVAVVRDTLYGCWCKGRASYMWPPLGLAYIGANLEQIGLKPELFDALALGVKYNEMKSEIEKKKPDIVIMNTATITFSEDLGVVKSIKESFPDTKIILVGTHVTAMPRMCLKEKEIDFIIQGETDYTVRELVESADKGYEKIRGLGFRKGNKIVLNPPRKPIENLDEVPFPARHLIPKNGKYFNPFAKKMPYTTAISSRGCPYQCIYCSSVILYGNKFRARSAENVVDEIELVKSQGCKEIFYRDETLTFDKKRIIKICDLIKERKIDISWMCNTRVDTVDRNLLQKMKNAGCHMVKFGVESGNQEVLNKLKKGITIHSIKKAFKASRDVGISTVAHFMFGNPDETIEQINQTISLSKKINPDYASFNITTPYPGTPLFEKYIGNVDSFEYWDMEKSLESGTFNEKFSKVSKQDIEMAFDRAYREFYFRPSYIMRKISKTNAKDMAKMGKAFFSLVKFMKLEKKKHERDAANKSK
jgi:radical SAM superfamily enzyme YgiQ (UPF0313 family)